jgi:hypothetical protein
MMIVPNGGSADYQSELSRRVTDNDTGQPLPKIFAFCNGGEPEWWNMAALSEDGEFLAGHLCSHPIFGPHDMGITSDWKHEHYRERYPGGFELVWVPGGVEEHEGISAAHAKHLSAGKDGTPWQRERAAAKQQESTES